MAKRGKTVRGLSAARKTPTSRKRTPADVDLKREIATLRRELAEALEQQTATSEVLQVISSTPGDLEPVFQSMLENATRVCGAKFGTMVLLEGDAVRRAALYNVPLAYADALGKRTFRPHPRGGLGQVIRTKQVAHIADLRTNAGYLEGDPSIVALSNIGGARTFVVVPMLKDAKLIGMISVFRQEVRPFSDRQIELLNNFAKQAVIAIENTRLLKELRESLQQQTATADVLKVISRSVFNLQAVLDALVESAAHLCDTDRAVLTRKQGDRYYRAALHGFPDEAIAEMKSVPVDLESGMIVARALRNCAVVHVADVNADPEYPGSPAQTLGGVRTVLSVPLIRETQPIGAITVSRTRVEPFTEKQIDLIKTFADQAVIAIENARLFDEVTARTEDLRESLQQQTATADVLKVISRSAFDLQTVLDTLVQSAARLADAANCFIFRREGDKFRLASSHGFTPEYREWMEQQVIEPGRHTLVGKTALQGRTVHIPDVLADADYTWGESIKRGNFRTMLGIPLMREGVPIGVIAAVRPVSKPFTEKQIELVSTFADQAVIAIENVRLFDEVQSKTRDLSEALTYQTGSGNILSVIASSPTDVEPVLKAIVESACELCDAYDAVVILKEGDDLRVSAHHGPIAMNRQRWPNDRSSASGRAMADRRPVHVRDMLADEGLEFALARGMSLVDGCRSLLSVPLLREGEPIGAIALRRAEVHPFTEKQIALLQTFADQAVIAIQNVRLFDEVQARTRDLTELLEQQTATAEILSSISGSMHDTKPVFEAIVRNLLRLFGTRFAVVQTLGDGVVDMPAADGQPGFERLAERYPRPLSGDTVGGLAMLEKRTVQVHPVLDNPAAPAATQDFARDFGFDSVLFTPMLSGDKVVGAIGVAQHEAVPFDSKQIALISSFANQAVIAIENTRLLRELRERTDDLGESLHQQTATAEVLKVISRSAFDLNSVLDTLVSSAARLCAADKGVIFQRDGEVYGLAATYGFSPEFIAYANENPVKADLSTTTGRVSLGGKTIHIPDVLADPDYTASEYQRLGDYRTTLGVPLLREGVPLGAFSLTRAVTQPFTPRQIELVETFADQAVIAIENARLFGEVQDRTRELSQSLDDLRAAQDRLIQTEKLASLGQLTAGIAHEIKNPLNFVNNFAALSAELTDELNETLKTAALTDKLRDEVGDLTRLLKENLEKVVQHGKRADLIVKNMLLHSREGSSERRLVNLNGLVEECLNLAYHGARAENQAFKTNLERSFDPTIGRIDLFPQEMTRVLLNLISNGFYAATKRKAETKPNSYEPTLAAATKNLGDRVEIKIRDNGGGIPAEVMDKIFNPFFTTKPPGEGTGLGLSLSYDIVVKQHGGSIEVDTRPGEFTEFKVILPRTAATTKAGADK